MLKCVVKAPDNKEVGTIDLDPAIFGLPIRADIIQRTVLWQLSKARAGTHASKGISQVSGTTKKPYRQKGTGRARQGSLRAPQFRGGGIIFGPVVRSHEHKLTKKFKKLALKTILSAKYQEGRICVIEKFPQSVYKTSAMANLLNNLQIESALFLCDEQEQQNMSRGIQNLPHVDILPDFAANVYSIISRENLVISKDTLLKLADRLK